MKLNKFLYLGVLSTGLLATSCEDFLDRAPITSITPEQYFKQDTELAAYTLNYYTSVLKSPAGGFNAGAINWDEVMTALEDIGYDGVYNMEVSLGRYGKSESILRAHAIFAMEVMNEILESRK